MEIDLQLASSNTNLKIQINKYKNKQEIMNLKSKKEKICNYNQINQKLIQTSFTFRQLYERKKQ